MKRYTADFETTNDINDCRIWAWAISDIDTQEFEYGNDIETFMKFIKNEKNCILYFHNLKFDGQFIIYYLLEKGFKPIYDKKDIKENTFSTLISDMGIWYTIEIYFNKGSVIKIYDSLKLLNMSVENVAKSFNLEIRKLKIDYNSYRAKGHNLTKEEIEYIKNDVEIMSKALKIMIDKGFTKITIGGNAINDYKYSNKSYNYYFPKLDDEEDEFIRKSYKGGFTYLNPIYKNKINGKGIVIDKNSMYPSIMRFKKLPYGKGIYFKGKYEYDKEYDLYVIRFTTSFKLKKGKIPTIQVKNSYIFLPNEYIEDTNYEILTLTLTNYDLELFLENYELTSEIDYIDGFKYKSKYGLFNNYIDKWTNEKIKSKKEKNSGVYLISKLFLNSLY